jgi:putative ABC transport system permease protein
MLFISLAWRNTQRNRRRTLLTLIATALGVTALMMIWSIFDGNSVQMIRNMTGNYTAHMQIHHAGYDVDPNLDLAFYPDGLDALHLAKMPGVVAVSPRLAQRSLISSDSNSRGILLTGIDPRQEVKVTTLYKKMTAGSYLKNGEKGGILIGSPLAKALKLIIGDEVTIVTQGMRGSIGAARYHVRGIYNTQNDMIDSQQAFVTLDDANELLAAQGELTTVAIKLIDHELAKQLAVNLGKRLGSTYEVLGWKQLLPGIAQYIAFHDGMVNLFMIVLFVIVSLGIANTILMSVIERIREFGVMMAVGTSPKQIFRLVVYEGLLIGLLGFGIGVVIGYPLITYFSAIGIEYGESAKAMRSMQTSGLVTTNVLYPYLDWYRVLVLAIVVFIVTALATAYPAWKTARMVPIRAMQGLTTRRMRFSGIGGAHSSANRFLLLVLALRNLSRHPLRSVLAVFSVTFGMAACVFLAAIANGYFSKLVENSTGLVTGDAQVQHKDFKVDMGLHLSLPNGTRLLHDIQKIPGIAAASPRLQTNATISTAMQSQPFLLTGVNPTEEKQVTFLYRGITRGHYLSETPGRDIVIGQKLANLLNVELGGKVVVSVLNASGELVSESLQVTGIFDTGNHGSDGALGYITLSNAQKILGMYDHITNIAIRFQDSRRMEEPLQKAAAIMPYSYIRVLPWQELLPEVAQISGVFKKGMVVVLGIVFLMVAVLVMNTILMSVLERTREFGIMLAIGTSPRKIVHLICLESVLMGVSGTLLGLLAGGFLVWTHLEKGINLAAHGATAVAGVTNIIYPKIEMEFLLQSCLLLPLLVLLASLYPAMRASRLEPVKAIRHA